MKKINVGMVDNNPLIRQGMAHLFSQTPDICLFWQGNGQEWITLLEQRPPDLLLIDFAMPMREELELTRYIHTYHSNLKILAFSAQHDEVHLGALIEAGAAGYISNVSDPDEIVSAIHTIARGSVYEGNGCAPNTSLFSLSD